MTIEIKVLGQKSSNIGICYSTKDRVDLTRLTVSRAMCDAGEYDFYWIDGSSSEEAKDLPIAISDGRIKFTDENHEVLLHEESPYRRLKEIHYNVKGGADVAILYNLSLLLERGYEYIGLIENDVLLETGWFKKTMELFDIGSKNEIAVGSVTARTYKVRTHIPRDGFAVMKNIGAGMVIFTAAAVQHVLDNFHTGTFGEPSFYFSNYTGIPGVVPWQLQKMEGKEQPNKMMTCADWFFEASMLPYGLASLGLTPSMAKNIDDAPQDDLQTEATTADPEFNWDAYAEKMLDAYVQNFFEEDYQDIVVANINNYDPVFKEWRAFPHQVVKSLPSGFQGNWKLKWTQFDGPFSMVSEDKESSITIPFNGNSVQIVYEDDGQGGTFLMEGSCGTGMVETKAEVGKKCINVTANHSGPHIVKITFNKPGVMLTYFTFQGPQPWFKARYGLRYADLAPYIKQ